MGVDGLSPPSLYFTFPWDVGGTIVARSPSNRGSESVCILFVVTTATEFSLFETREVLKTRIEFTQRNASTSVAGGRTCYGDINRLKPTGESSAGVPGSQAEVRTDMPELKKRWDFYQRVADANCIQASVIAAIASRESRGGALLYKTNGYGDFGRAFGILQCDLKHSGLPCLSCIWYSGVAAYNKGVSRVNSWPDVDRGTTHNDYSNDVIARAQYLYRLGWN
ncbi:goose-type lysozyme 2 [Plakobranchus ocellatus]|uniref:Goose-type lysozyme 2 n=1 Tax=Plakobranchus ocellatus TaxID=259542 RepID=A0AAV3YU98_9GAST|nr:goose-type lysozyme 2 [Plakobranchus ocellatus]